MDAVSYTELRQNLKTFMDRVYTDHSPLIVTRKNNKNVVMISIDEYNSLVETDYLMTNKANYEHLKESIDQYQKGKAKRRELTEIKDE